MDEKERHAAGMKVRRKVLGETHVDRSIDAPAAFLHTNVVGTFTLLEAGASDGRLSRAMLDGLAADAPDVAARVRPHLAEHSPEARLAQPRRLISRRQRNGERYVQDGDDQEPA